MPSGRKKLLLRLLAPSYALLGAIVGAYIGGAFAIEGARIHRDSVKEQEVVDLYVEWLSKAERVEALLRLRIWAGDWERCAQALDADPTKPVSRADLARQRQEMLSQLDVAHEQNDLKLFNEVNDSLSDISDTAVRLGKSAFLLELQNRFVDLNNTTQKLNLLDRDRSRAAIISRYMHLHFDVLKIMEARSEGEIDSLLSDHLDYAATYSTTLVDECREAFGID